MHGNSMECAFVHVERGRRGGIWLRYVMKWEAEKPGPGVPTMHRWDDAAWICLCVCLMQDPYERHQVSNFTVKCTHTCKGIKSSSGKYNWTSWGENTPRPETVRYRKEGWKSGCEHWVKGSNIKKRFVCFLRLSSLFLPLQRSVSKSTLSFSMYLFVSIPCFG